jgi:TPR repeat protein
MDPSSITGWLSQLSGARLRELFAEGAERASGWVRILAIEGIAQAQVCYGRMLLEGTGLLKNKHDALFWFKRAASQGDLDGFNMVGRCHENGWGCEIDVGLAAAYYHTAADAGHAWAQYNLGHLYLDGIAVGRDAHKAFRYYQSAAAQQHSRAMNLAGRCCEEGWGTPRDLAQAAHWYRRSAVGGYFRGQYNWASVLLACGCAGEAALWFERAASSGTPAVRDAVLQVAALPRSPEPIAALMVRLRSRCEAPSA